MERVHSRLHKDSEGVCWFDDDVISGAEYVSLRRHYFTLLDKLARPWLTRDEWKPDPHYETYPGRAVAGGRSYAED